MSLIQFAGNMRRGFFGFCLVSCAALPALAQVNYPPLSVEISLDHPLFIFNDSGPAETTPEAYAQHVVDAWATLPPALKPFSIMQVDADRADAHTYYQAFLPALQAANLPVVARVASSEPGQRYPLDKLELLLQAFTSVKGIEVTGLAFNEYDLNAQGGSLLLPTVQWLIGAIDTAARYGRFIYVPLDELHWPRIMANTCTAALYQKIRECRDYVIPANLHRDPHVMARTSALLGLWLEESVTNWGIAADARWYTDARFITPGVFGIPAGPPAPPASLYRAMVLNGAMAGATVYSFSPQEHLWFGATPQYWKDAIYPTLRELVDLALIARKDFVLKKTPVAYQLAPAATPLDFHLNLRDIDPILDQGLLAHGVYGVQRAGQIPEFIINRNGAYWVPLLSAYAPEAALAQFQEVVKPGRLSTPEQWQELSQRSLSPDGEGTAFIAQVMRGIFVMNTAENTMEPQTYSLPAVPAPVRELVVKRENGLPSLSWPGRPEDLSWDVYKRVLPEPRFERVAKVDQPSYIDEAPGIDQPVAYAVVALTETKEPLAGEVNYGEYLALSTLYSRIVEEAVLSPVLTEAETKPVPLPTYAPVLTPSQDQPDPLVAPPPAPLKEWWPVLENVPTKDLAVAQTIVKQIEGWELALGEENLDAAMAFYADDYKDPQGWERQYVRRAYQWLIERYGALRMDRQIRRWDFSNYESGGIVNVLLYVRICGVAVSDPSGRYADQTISIPRTESEEVWVSWSNRGGDWRIVQTNPALPNFGDLLSYSSGPYDYFPIGPDVWEAPAVAP